MLYILKNTKKLTVQDMKGLASFNRVVMNYLKILKIENSKSLKQKDA